MSGRTIGIKAFRIIFVLVIVALIGYQSGAWVKSTPHCTHGDQCLRDGHQSGEWFRSGPQCDESLCELLEPAREIFPQAQAILPGEVCPKVFDADRELIGFVFDSHEIPETLDIYGYAGAVPVLVGITQDHRIAGITLLENKETPRWIEGIRDRGFLESWDGLELSEVNDHPVDTITRATLSTSAIIRTVQHCTAKLADKPPPPPVTLADALTPANYAIAAVILVGLVSFFAPRKLGWLRPWVMLASIAVLGFWSVTMVSLSLLNGWIENGIPWIEQPMVVVIAAIAILFPIVFSKSFYCTHLCPFGACQELVNKLPTKKKNLPKPFRYVRVVLLVGVAAVLLFPLDFDPATISPFTAFQVKTASTLVLCIAGAGILASLFLRRPWCNYFCPVGALVDQFRKGAKPKKKMAATEAAPPEEEEDGC